MLPDSLCSGKPELSAVLHSTGCCYWIPHRSRGPGSTEFDGPVSEKSKHDTKMSQLKSHCSLNWHQQQIRVGNEGPVILPTSVSQSVSAFCLRRISTSTWLRACFSLTSKAPLSVSVFLSISLHDPSSCSVFSHLRRQSSKFCAIWIKSRGKWEHQYSL